MQRALISVLTIALAVITVNAQETVKPTQESRPADPRPAVTELNLNVNPDSQFYKLASGTRMENNGTNAWKLNTLGFRELRIVVSMGADSRKENRATGSSVVVTMHTNDGDHEVEIGEMDVPISAGKVSGKAFVFNIFNSSTTIRATTKNIGGNVWVTAYVVK